MTRGPVSRSRRAHRRHGRHGPLRGQTVVVHCEQPLFFLGASWPRCRCPSRPRSVSGWLPPQWPRHGLRWQERIRALEGVSTRDAHGGGGLVTGLLRRWDIFHHLAAPAVAYLLAPNLFRLFREVRLDLQRQRRPRWSRPTSPRGEPSVRQPRNPGR